MNPNDDPGSKTDTLLHPVPRERYGDAYASDYLSMYHAYVASADSVSQRRANANSFFWTVSLGLLGVTTFFAPEGSDLVFLVALAGMLLSFGWLRALESYRSLNAAKFEVIQAMEKQLPLAPFTAEWQVCLRQSKARRHEGLTVSEQWVPKIFILLHATVAISGFVRWLW